MTNPIGDPGHGHSPAAWTTVVIMLVAIAAGTVFFFLEMQVAVWVCVALLVLGPIVGWILSRAGWGVNGPKYVPKSH